MEWNYPDLLRLINILPLELGEWRGAWNRWLPSIWTKSEGLVRNTAAVNLEYFPTLPRKSLILSGQPTQYLTNGTQFWYYLPGYGICVCWLRAQPCTSDTSCMFTLLLIFWPMNYKFGSHILISGLIMMLSRALWGNWAWRPFLSPISHRQLQPP